jgi:acetoin utilization deacetylase AcuC-like enzyme
MSTDSSRRTFLRQASGALVAFGSGVLPAIAANSTLQAFYDPAVLRHEPSADHPESPKRVPAVMNAIRAIERQGQLSVGTPRAATEDQILLVHTREYVDKVRAEIAAGQRELSTGDTEISPGSFVAALAAAGTVTSAIDAVVAGGLRRAFCAVRPPGHHASQARGMGFCLFNNVAIGARYARTRYGVERILIADWDVHHGNGTQAIFWNDGSVLFFDTHQHPWYPGTGSPDERGDGKARGLIVNHPFPAGSGRREIVGVFRTELVAAADRFRPQLVLVSAGFDSRAGDPLGQFTLNDADFAALTDVTIEIAERHASGRLVSVLEGGYSLDGLARGVTAHVGRLAT